MEVELQLAGVGVAYKMAMAIAGKLGLEEDYCEKYIDLVALGTSADIVPQ